MEGATGRKGCDDFFTTSDLLPSFNKLHARTMVTHPAERIMQEIRRFLDLPDLELDASGTSLLEIQETRIAVLKYDAEGERVTFMVEIAPCVNLTREVLLRMMEFNFLNALRPSATFGIEDEAGAVFLSDSFHVDEVEAIQVEQRLTALFETFHDLQGMVPPEELAHHLPNRDHTDNTGPDLPVCPVHFA